MPSAPPELRVSRVLVSMLNFNSGQDALLTLACLERQDYGAKDLVVFDNASQDGSRQAIEAAFPHIPVVNTGANLGYCGGNNAALERGLAGGYDAVIIANHDIGVAPDAVSRMMRVAAQSPDAGLVGAQEVDGQTGAFKVLGGRQYNFWRSRQNWIRGAPAVNDSGPLDMDYVQGALVLFTRAALERGIRLNDEMFAYWDEVDLGLQVARAGLKARVEPAVLVRHHSRGRAFGLVEGYLSQRNRWYLVRRYGSPAQQAVNFLYTLLIELPAKVALRALQGQWRYGVACAQGFLDGVRGITGPGRIERLGSRPPKP